MNITTAPPLAGSFPSKTFIVKMRSSPLDTGRLGSVTTTSVISFEAPKIEIAAFGGLTAKLSSPSETSFMKASRVMCPAVRTGRSQKKMIFGFAPLRVNRSPSKTIAFASCTNNMSQASSSAWTGRANVADRSNITNSDLIRYTSKFKIIRLINELAKKFY